MNDKQKKAFTLSEVLIALIVVGFLAVMVIPTLVNKVHNKIFTNQIKNMSAMIEQLAQDELVTNKTRNLSDTDFADPAKLLTDEHFSVSKTCSEEDKCFDNSYKSLDGEAVDLFSRGTKTISSNEIILNNAVLLAYLQYEDYPSKAANSDGSYVLISPTKWLFIIDVNGKDKPNIVGRDVFSFIIDDSGHIESPKSYKDTDTDTRISKCKSGESDYCFHALRSNNWKMPY